MARCFAVLSGTCWFLRKRSRSHSSAANTSSKSGGLLSSVSTGRAAASSRVNRYGIPALAVTCEVGHGLRHAELFEAPHHYENAHGSIMAYDGSSDEAHRSVRIDHRLERRSRNMMAARPQRCYASRRRGSCLGWLAQYHVCCSPTPIGFRQVNAGKLD